MITKWLDGISKILDMNFIYPAHRLEAHRRRALRQELRQLRARPRSVVVAAHIQRRWRRNSSGG